MEVFSFQLGTRREWVKQVMVVVADKEAGFDGTVRKIVAHKAQNGFGLPSGRFLQGFDAVAQMVGVGVWQIAERGRITSYNVCYTKLLRCEDGLFPRE